MSLLLDRPTLPEKRIVHRLGSWKRVKRLKDRRVFRLAEDATTATLVPLAGGQPRKVNRVQLDRDFVPVARCPVCNWHHDTREQTRHRGGRS